MNVIQLKKFAHVSRVIESYIMNPILLVENIQAGKSVKAKQLEIEQLTNSLFILYKDIGVQYIQESQKKYFDIQKFDVLDILIDIEKYENEKKLLYNSKISEQKKKAFSNYKKKRLELKKALLMGLLTENEYDDKLKVVKNNFMSLFKL